MGTCVSKPNNSAEISPSDFTVISPVLKLYGSDSTTLTSLIRIALIYKSVSFQFIPSENTLLQYGSDTFTGTFETLIRYIEDKFPKPPLLDSSVNSPGGNQVVPAIVMVITLQHKSMTWHIQRLMNWAKDLETRGKSKAVDLCMGSPVMEVRKFGRSYSQLLELMLEHAQMEERVIFPVFERADRGLSKVVNEDHARDLPIMNGIKEDIKSIGVLVAASPVYQEALLSLSSRFKTLQEHCKEHFEEEETKLLPLLEATEMSKEEQDKMVDQCLEVMEGSHSHLFNFLILGLLPHDAIQYLIQISKCSKNTDRVSSMLQTLTTRIESTIASSNCRSL